MNIRRKIKGYLILFLIMETLMAVSLNMFTTLMRKLLVIGFSVIDFNWPTRLSLCLPKYVYLIAVFGIIGIVIGEKKKLSHVYYLNLLLSLVCVMIVALVVVFIGYLPFISQFETGGLVE